MNILSLKGFLVIIALLILMFIASYSYVTIADSDNETAVQNAARNAMTQAVNLGTVRVDEKITINEELAKEAFIRQYADAVDFYGGDRYINIHEVSSDPAMIAVESYTKVKTPFMGMTERFTKKKEDGETLTRSRDIVIFEAKDKTKQNH